MKRAFQRALLDEEDAEQAEMCRHSRNRAGPGVSTNAHVVAPIPRKGGGMDVLVYLCIGPNTECDAGPHLLVRRFGLLYSPARLEDQPSRVDPNAQKLRAWPRLDVVRLAPDRIRGGELLKVGATVRLHGVMVQAKRLPPKKGQSKSQLVLRPTASHVTGATPEVRAGNQTMAGLLARAPQTLTLLKRKELLADDDDGVGDLQHLVLRELKAAINSMLSRESASELSEDVTKGIKEWLKFEVGGDGGEAKDPNVLSAPVYPVVSINWMDPLPSLGNSKKIRFWFVQTATRSYDDHRRPTWVLRGVPDSAPPGTTSVYWLSASALNVAWAFDVRRWEDLLKMAEWLHKSIFWTLIRTHEEDSTSADEATYKTEVLDYSLNVNLHYLLHTYGEALTRDQTVARLTDLPPLPDLKNRVGQWATTTADRLKSSGFACLDTEDTGLDHLDGPLKYYQLAGVVYALVV